MTAIRTTGIANAADVEDLGTLFRISRSIDNAGAQSKLEVGVGDIVEMEWNYQTIPGQIPIAVDLSVDGSALRPIESRSVIPVISDEEQPVGYGTVSAYYLAQGVGDAIIRMTISVETDEGPNAVVLQAAVNVRGK